MTHWIITEDGDLVQTALIAQISKERSGKKTEDFVDLYAVRAYTGHLTSHGQDWGAEYNAVTLLGHAPEADADTLMDVLRVNLAFTGVDVRKVVEQARRECGPSVEAGGNG